jgi:hypothetical protein
LQGQHFNHFTAREDFRIAAFLPSSPTRNFHSYLIVLGHDCGGKSPVFQSRFGPRHYGQSPAAQAYSLPVVLVAFD